MTIDGFGIPGNIGNKTFKEYLIRNENGCIVLFSIQKILKQPFGTKMPQVQVLSPRPQEKGVSTKVLIPFNVYMYNLSGLRPSKARKCPWGTSVKKTVRW